MTEQGKALAVWQSKLEHYREHFQEALPVTVKRTMPADRMIRVVINAMWRLPQLQQCTIPSIVMGTMDCAQLGLELAGPLGHAYLIPFRDNKSGTSKAQTIIGYKGLITLATRSSELRGPPWANVVREADVASGRFELDIGGGSPPRHSVDPMLSESDRGAVVGAYAVVSFVGGAHKVEWMSRDQLDGIRARSRSRNNGPWVTDEVEMQRKTVMRRLLKTTPLSSDIGRAMYVDEVNESGAARNAYLEYQRNFAASVMGEPETLDQTAEWSDDKLDGIKAKVRTPRSEWDEVGPPPMDSDAEG